MFYKNLLGSFGAKTCRQAWPPYSVFILWNSLRGMIPLNTGQPIILEYHQLSHREHNQLNQEYQRL